MKITLKIAEDGKWIGLMVTKELGERPNGGAIFVLVSCKDGMAQLLDEDCVAPPAPRIRYGKDAQPGTTPWMAQLKVNNTFMCGGTLIHPWFVLTAAHCFDETDHLSVILGQYETYCHPPNCTQSEEINVIKAIQHPEYSRVRQKSDIALLKLEKKVDYKTNIRSICIVMDDEINHLSTKVFRAYGWGQTEKASTSRVLQTIALFRVDSRICRGSDPEKEICARANLGDTCYGDSGGPIAANITYRREPITTQFGITSRGSKHCNSYAYYTNVYGFKKWINDTVLAKTENKNQLLDDDCSNIWRTSGSIRQPWKVHILPRYYKGALITNRFVVTVAKDLPAEAEKVKVQSLGGRIFSVEAVYKHPDFRRYPLITNNIALIKLNEDVPYSGKYFLLTDVFSS
nr:chymotrypsin-like protease CTRL-1 [Drosophila takahashii]